MDDWRPMWIRAAPILQQPAELSNVEQTLGEKMGNIPSQEMEAVEEAEDVAD